MTEQKPIYVTDTAAEYWQKVAKQERQKADANMRLAAERGSEIADLHKTLDEVKTDYIHACKTIADMHAAAVGEITGPRRGVVEDVADLRAEADRLKDIIRKVEWVNPPARIGTYCLYCALPKDYGHHKHCPFHQWEGGE